MFDHDFKEWLIGAIVMLSRQLNSIQRKLDALLNASTSVSTEQLAELTRKSHELETASDALAAAIEQQKQKG